VKRTRLALARPRTTRSASSGSIYPRLGQFVLSEAVVNLAVGSLQAGRHRCCGRIPIRRPFRPKVARKHHKTGGRAATHPHVIVRSIPASSCRGHSRHHRLARHPAQTPRAPAIL
jgi:hypothetical protein